ncbi:HU family DNA-binding protein [Thiovibrio sp. JS02]
MNKADLIASIAEKSGMTKVQAEISLNNLLTIIADTLKKGDSVTLVGFGTFAVSSRAARNGRNPKTGQTMKIPARKVVKFKPGKKLTDSVN